MNLYEKLQAVRVELAAQGIKKGKKNTYSNYEYYELADFLPQVMKLCQDHKIMPAVSYSDNIAMLTIYDCEKPDAKIEFTTPMSTAKLKACHEVQNLGAVMTYERRYLYMTAFEIVESDILEMPGNDPLPEPIAKASNPERFTWDIKKPTLDEIIRLWEFVGWGTGNDAMKYLETRAKNMNAQLDDAFYRSVMLENLDYCKRELQSGNPQYLGKSFDDSVPF